MCINGKIQISLRRLCFSEGLTPKIWIYWKQLHFNSVVVQIPHGKSATHQLEEKYLFYFARVKEGKQEESVGELLAFPACTHRGGRSHPETSLLHCFLFKSDPSHHSIPTSSILSILPPWVSPPPTNKGTKDLGWFYVYNPPSLLGQGLSFTTLSLHSSPLTWHHRWAPKKARNLF